jgi:hypothetical protein
MTFRIPKNMKIAATGDLVSEQNEGGESVSVWKSGRQPVAGFNFGKFKMQEVKLDKPEYLVQSYANEEPPDVIKNLLHVANADLPTQGSHMTQGAAPGKHEHGAAHQESAGRRAALDPALYRLFRTFSLQAPCN